jgi:hypothetical protein
MSKDTFEENPTIRKGLRYFLMMQIGAVLVVFILIALNLHLLALVLSLMTFMIFIAILIWLYLVYTKLSLVQEKRAVQQRVNELQVGFQLQSKAIQLVHQKREYLERAEKDEIQSTLEILQNNYIKTGLEANFIRDATIPGIGPKLKEKLSAYGIVSAAQVSDHVSNISGFGEAKRLALMSWRSLVYARLEHTKPTKLTLERSESIKIKFQTLQDENSNAGQQAQDKKLKLETELNKLLPRLESLSAITFIAFLNKSLASQGLLSGFIAFVLFSSQTVSGFSATTSAILASIPTSTQTSTPTSTPTNTFTPTLTFTSTSTSTSTITFTSTVTFTPTITFTPTRTRTPIPTRTNTRLPTWTPAPGGGNNANCHPSYPTVCILPRPPDLDCDDIQYTNFRVLPPDPHNFDDDEDGIGCES